MKSQGGISPINTEEGFIKAEFQRMDRSIPSQQEKGSMEEQDMFRESQGSHQE